MRNDAKRMVRWTSAVVLVTAACAAAQAASPVLTSVLPRGGQRGTELEVTFAGDRLADAQELFLYDPGLSVKKLEAVDAKRVKALISVAPDAPLGEHRLRVRTATGVSELRTFWVGALPGIDEKEPNNDPAKPQKVALNTTINGVIRNEDVDIFAVELKKGQRVTAEIEGIRLGGTMFDPCVAILNATGAEVAASDDSALHLQDPVASLIVPEDGTYVVQVRDGSYGGSDVTRYRLHLGTFPRPMAIYPAGGKAGEPLDAEMIADATGSSRQKIFLPPEPTDEYGVLAEQGGEVAPSGNVIRVSAFENVLEAEPNNDVKTATPAGLGLPVALNGRLETPGDSDWFRFGAKKGEALDVQVYARRLRSPLDPSVSIHDAAGKRLAANDDTNGPDSYLRFAPPADGEYSVRVADHLGAGGADHVYRIEVMPVRPRVTLTIPLVAPNSQERQAIAVPRGNRFATMVRATRADFDGALKLMVENLPPGVICHETVVPDGVDAVPVVFEAAPDATASGCLTAVKAVPIESGAVVDSSFVQAADLVVFGNQTAYYQSKVDRLAVAVTEEAPYSIEILQPKAPLVQGGSMQLKVVARRKPGFTAPIKLSVPFKPPGVGAGDVTIAENGSEATVPLNASRDARVSAWKVCVLGSADSNGPVWVSTQLASLDVAPPMVAGKIEMAAGERGNTVQVLCKLDQKQPFEGPAKAELLGLPPNASAEAKEITSKDTEVVFDVVTGEKTPIGQHKTLACAVTIMQDGEPVRHGVASGGVLRIDASRPKPATAAAVASSSDPQKPVKPLSRLEKLRQERAAGGGAK